MIIIIIILVLVLLYCLLQLNKIKNENTNIKNQRVSEWMSELDKTHTQELKKKEEELLKAQGLIDSELRRGRQRVQEELNSSQSIIKETQNKQREQFNKELEQQKIALEQIKQSINDAAAAKQNEHDLILSKAEEVFREGLDSLNDMAADEKDNILNSIEELKQELADYQKLINAKNQEILRQREIEEQQEFYKIQLSETTIKDIEILNSVREKLTKREYLDKMIYDNYISKSVKEMTKRVLNGRDPSGIYRITNILTNEAYVGKSVHVADRWCSHIKTACGLSGVADSQFQRALKKYGIQNWTFELIEECSKDILTEREKYWITYYNTKTYGYNMREG